MKTGKKLTLLENLKALRLSAMVKHTFPTLLSDQNLIFV